MEGATASFLHKLYGSALRSTARVKHSLEIDMNLAFSHSYVLILLGLALFLLAGGLKILVLDRRRDAERAARPGLTAPPKEVSGFRFPLLVGVLQGAANPALFVNWTLLISFLVGHRILPTGLLPAGVFAVGVGLGVFAWFAILVELVERLRNHPSGEWIHKSSFAAGVLLLGFGLWFSWRTVAELVSGIWIP